MKLMFLIEHYDLKTNKLVNDGLLNNDFIIYHYGVFSFKVMEDYFILINTGLVTEYPIKAVSIELGLEPGLKAKADKILSQFGEKNSDDLEIETLAMLKLDRVTKMEHFGKNVKTLIKK
ncbi:hypothetical protein HYX00_05015 [Candidatus Woesearchaeota archaeon]|nr:hypothetical protein [Candidatus Woesearchaeota archaeon]